MVCAALRRSYDMLGSLEPLFNPSYCTWQHIWQVFLRNRDQIAARCGIYIGDRSLPTDQNECPQRAGCGHLSNFPFVMVHGQIYLQVMADRIPGPYLSLHCRCGHSAVLYEDEDGADWILNFMPVDLAKLRCTKCKERGKISDFRKGWATAREWNSSN